MTRKRPLHDTELAVLEFVQMRENATVNEIAKGVGTTTSRARYCLDSLLERKVLHRYVHINVYPLGYFEVDLLVKLRHNSPALCGKIIQWCIDSDKVSFLSEAGGRQDLRISLTVRSISEVHQFIETACEKFNHPFSEKQILPIMQLFVFGAPKGKGDWEKRTLRFGFTPNTYEPSKVDHDLLKIICREPSLSARDFARRLGVPSSTLSYRLHRLEDAGVIAGYSYLFDPHGSVVEHFHAKVSVGGASPSVRKAIHAWCANHPDVPLYGEVQGAFDFFVCIKTLRSLGAIEAVRSLHQALDPYDPHIELYPSPTLRKLVKYPFR
jgi:DNA-binding Lrp family transcriptional regulator